jgi:hypothetical protein
MAQQTLTLKRGSGFAWIFDIPTDYADGYFATGWTWHSQAINAETDEVVADLSPAWVDAVTTRAVQLTENDTANWPERVLVDVIFKRISDGFVIPTDTVVVRTERQVSRVVP